MPDRVPILILDDPPGALSGFREQLCGERYRVELLHSLGEARRALLRQPYACVLSNLETNGSALAKMLQAHPELREVPILFVTDDPVASEALEQSCQLGPYDFISGPLDATLLRRKLRMFSLLFQQRHAIDRQKSLLEAVLTSSHEGVAVWGEDAALPEYVNERWRHLFANPQESTPTLQSLRQQVLEGHQPAEQDLEQSESGRIVHLNARLLPGENERVLILAREVTAERLEKRRLQTRQEELEQFAHVASHDLRTPLRHISAFADILAGELESPSPVVQEALTMIGEGVNRMRGLIDCLLAYAEVERVVERGTPVSLTEVVRQAWRVINSPYGQLQIEEPLPRVEGDPIRLGQLFQNLIENALKFARPGVEPQIQVGAVSGPAGTVIRVRDNGIGIPVQHRQRIFQVFQRLHTRQEYSGNGIGLAICQRVMTQHGGQIEVLSDGHSGATFQLHFPRRYDVSQRTGT